MSEAKWADEAETKDVKNSDTTNDDDDTDEVGDEETSWQWKWIVNLYGIVIKIVIDIFWVIVELRKSKRAIFAFSIVLELLTLVAMPFLLLFSWFAPKGDILDLIYKFDKFVPFRTLNLPSRTADRIDTKIDQNVPAAATASSTSDPVVSILLIHGSSFNWTQWIFGIFYLVREWIRSGRTGRWRLYVVNYNSNANIIGKLLPFTTSNKGVDDYARQAVRDKIRNDIFPGTCRVSFYQSSKDAIGSYIPPQIDFDNEVDKRRQYETDIAGPLKAEDMAQNRLVLIGHGIGGLIAQEYVNAVAQADGVQVLGIFTLATPWFGLKLLEYRDYVLRKLYKPIVKFQHRLAVDWWNDPSAKIKLGAESKLHIQLRKDSLFCTQMRNSGHSDTNHPISHGNIKSPNDLVVEAPNDAKWTIKYGASTTSNPNGAISWHDDRLSHLGHYSILASPTMWSTISEWLNLIKPTASSASPTVSLPSPSSTSSADSSTNTSKSNALSLD